MKKQSLLYFVIFCISTYSYSQSTILVKSIEKWHSTYPLEFIKSPNSFYFVKSSTIEKGGAEYHYTFNENSNIGFKLLYQDSDFYYLIDIIKDSKNRLIHNQVIRINRGWGDEDYFKEKYNPYTSDKMSHKLIGELDYNFEDNIFIMEIDEGEDSKITLSVSKLPPLKKVKKYHLNPKINKEFNAYNYEQKAIAIINNHRDELQKILSQVLKNTIDIIKDVIETKKNNVRISHTYQDLLNLNNKKDNESVRKFMTQEIIINEAFNNLKEELSRLNDDYYNHFSKQNIRFEDFYDANRIRIADEVIIKLDELINDEVERKNREVKRNSANVLLTLVAIVPGAGVSLNLIKHLAIGAKAIRSGIKIKKMSKTATYIYENLNKKAAGKVSKLLSNATKRASINRKLSSVSTSGDIAQFSNEMSGVFKSIENKIEGRIGDGSSWILAVHFQELRDIILKNKNKIK